MIWIAWQSYDPKAQTIDMRLASDTTGWSKAHSADWTYDGDWDWKDLKAICGARIPNGQDGEVVQFRVNEVAKHPRCAHCEKKLLQMTPTRRSVV